MTRSCKEPISWKQCWSVIHSSSGLLDKLDSVNIWYEINMGTAFGGKGKRLLMLRTRSEKAMENAQCRWSKANFSFQFMVQYGEIGRWSLAWNKVDKTINSPNAIHTICLGQLGELRSRYLVFKGSSKRKSDEKYSIRW